jgi:hypothetical protein
MAILLFTSDNFDFEPLLPPPRKETSSERNFAHSFDRLEIVNSHQPPQIGDSFFVASSAPSSAKSVNSLSVKNSTILDLLDLYIPITSWSFSFTSAAATATMNKQVRPVNQSLRCRPSNPRATTDSHIADFPPLLIHVIGRVLQSSPGHRIPEMRGL